MGGLAPIVVRVEIHCARERQSLAAVEQQLAVGVAAMVPDVTAGALLKQVVRNFL